MCQNRSIRLFIYCLLCLPALSQAQKAASPHVILIIADDLNWDDIGPYGNAHVKTPHLDQMAKEGMKFNNLFLTASSCSPSRTSILTGRYPHNTGSAELHIPLPAHLSYFPEVLKEEGYHTVLAGKWHEGPHTRRAYDTLVVDRKLNGEGGEEQWVNLLKTRPKDKPFFGWFAAYDAHRPWSSQTNAHRHNPTSEIEVPDNLVDDLETRKDLAAYYDEIARLDAYVGAVTEELKLQGIYENTIMLFISDNGRPFPGSKTRLYDTGLRSPLLVRWPAVITAGQTCQSLISSIDIAATLLNAAGLEASETMQGRSFFKLFQSPQSNFRNYVFAEHNWHDYSAYERSIRTKDHLYIINKRQEFDNGGPIDANQSPSAASLNRSRQKGTLSSYQQDVFLTPRPAEEFFTVQSDPFHLDNKIDKQKHKATVELLRSKLAQWQQETGDTVPEVLTPDWYDRKTGAPLPAKGTRGELPGASRGAQNINHSGPF